MYTPILRNRRSEMLGLSDIQSDVQSLMMPLFDVAAPTKRADQEKAEKYVINNIVRTEKIAKGFGSVFVDSSELDPVFRLPGNIHPLSAAAAAVSTAGATAIPVTGLHRDAAHHQAALDATDPFAGLICIRLDATDVGTARLTYKGIKDVVQAAGVNSMQVFLLLDMQCLHGLEPGDVVKPVNRLILLLNEQNWAGIIVGGYGMPEQLSTAVQTKEQAYLPRVEQKMFNSLNSHSLKSPLWFADYTVLPPSVVELDWRLIGRVMSPKALYALEDTWLVVRGGAFSSHPDGYDQYFSIAEEIVALDEYSGVGYSAGDDYIADKALHVGKPGSPASWITACVNHHVTLTARTHSA